MARMGLLDVFEARAIDAKRALVRREWADAIAAALLEGRGCVPAGKQGRGGLTRFPYEQGWGVIRPYLRGGAIRHVLHNAYVIVNRPLRELRVHAEVFQAGLTVPEPLGVLWERHGLLVRGALATHEVEAIDLLEYVARYPETTDAALRRCGAQVRRMHDMGVFHADLQVRNLLVGEEHVYLIDFDKARLVRALSRLDRARNLFRLRRSFEKNGVPLAFFDQLCEAYGVDNALPSWTGRVYRTKGSLSDRISGRGHR